MGQAERRKQYERFKKFENEINGKTGRDNHMSFEAFEKMLEIMGIDDSEDGIEKFIKKIRMETGNESGDDVNVAERLLDGSGFKSIEKFLNDASYLMIIKKTSGFQLVQRNIDLNELLLLRELLNIEIIEKMKSRFEN